MTKNNPIISTWQIFSVLLLTRLLSILTFVPLFTKGLNTSDYLMAVLISTMIILIASLPLYYQYKKYKNKSIIDISEESSTIFSKVVGVSYALLFIFYALTAASRMNLFVETITSPTSSGNLFIVFSVILACYGAMLGLEAISRSGAISFVIFCFAFGVIMFTMISKIDMNNFSPVFYNAISPSFDAGFKIAANTVEIPIMAIILTKAKGNKVKGYFAWLIAFCLISFIIFFVTIGGIGEFGFTQLFPIHSVAVLSEFSLLERLDVLLTGVWILSAFIKMCLLLYLQGDILSNAFGKSHKKMFIIGAGAIIIITHLIFSKSIKKSTMLLSDQIKVGLFIAFALIIPISILAVNKICLRKRVNK
ncbi:MAG: GerAB/ArcD/ProY family transporter [Oscillospiraceae bacterium]